MWFCGACASAFACSWFLCACAKSVYIECKEYGKAHEEKRKNHTERVNMFLGVWCAAVGCLRLCLCALFFDNFSAMLSTLLMLLMLFTLHGFVCNEWNEWLWYGVVLLLLPLLLLLLLMLLLIYDIGNTMISSLSSILINQLCDTLDFPTGRFRMFHEPK